MKISKVGLILALIYFFIAMLFVIYANILIDPKSKFVILQLPLALQMAGLHEIGLLKYITNISWTMAYIIIGIPTFLLFYLIGCFVDEIFSRK